jgi:ATP-dependent DNA helicase RecQ
LLFNYSDVFTQEFFIDSSAPPRELVQEVYAALCSFGTDEVQVTIKSLAASVPTRTSEMAVSACLKILEKAGHIERGIEGGHARIRLLEQSKAIDEDDEPPHAKEVLAYCAEALTGKPGESMSVALQDMAEALQMKMERLSRTLSAMQREGLIDFKPPFRGRGVRILERVPVSRINVNFAAIQRRREFEERKLRRMIEYAYSRQCLRKFILEYFGDRAGHNFCHNCSLCESAGEKASPRVLTEQEMTVVLKVLSCVARMKGRYGKMRVIQVLTGSRDKAIEYLKLDRLSTFGILRELKQTELREIIDALVEFRLLEIEGLEYPLLKLSSLGSDCMLDRVRPEMIFPLDLESRAAAEVARNERKGARNAASEKQSYARNAPYHAGLFEDLRRLRRSVASEAQLPPYIIFHDETLKEISRRLPGTLQELSRISGIGGKKIELYGGQVIAAVQQFLQANPQATPVLQYGGTEISVIADRKGASTAELTWTLWQDGKTIGDIATARGLSCSTITGHLVELIQQGRNIDLDRILTAERRAVILRAAAQAGGDRLTPIKALLPPDVSFDEIRLVLAQQQAKTGGECSASPPASV